MHQKVFLCGGQGNQYYLMGKELYEGNPLFKQWMDTGDTVFQKLTGNSLISILFNKNKKKSDIFSSLKETHPTLFAIEYALGMTLKEEGIRPDIVVGVSLGEFVASALSGVMSYRQALSLVVKQAECITSHAPAGRMIAILESPDFYAESDFLNQNSTFAGVFSPDLFVISCLSDVVRDIENFLDDKSIVFQVLPVEFGFHSSHINAASESFLAYAEKMDYKKPEITYFSSYTTSQVPIFTPVHFWKAIREPMQFRETIVALECTGN